MGDPLPSFEQPPIQSNPRELACIAGQLAVKQKLSNPSAATFGSCLGAPGVTDDGQSKYLARAVFETPDASGIQRQHGYTVSVELAEKTYKTFILRID